MMGSTAVALFASLDSEDRVKRATQKQLIEEKVSQVSALDDVDGYLVGEPSDRSHWNTICESRETVQPATLGMEENDSLRDRSQRAARRLFERGYQQVLLVACDVPELTETHLRRAISSLQRAEASAYVSPAPDGGFNLLGLNSWQGEIFANVPFYCSFTRDRLYRQLKRLQYHIVTGETLQDIDRFDDWFVLPLSLLKTSYGSLLRLLRQIRRSHWISRTTRLLNPTLIGRIPPSRAPPVSA